MSAGKTVKAELNNRHRLMMPDPLQELQLVIDALNGEDPRLSKEGHASLLRYVEAWNRAKRNPSKMELSRADWKRFSLPNLQNIWRLNLAPDVSGAYWWLSPTGENFRDIAAFYASLLLTNSLRGKLSDGPCKRTRCAKWFIKKRAEQKTCSTRCLCVVRSAVGNKEERKTSENAAGAESTQGAAEVETEERRGLERVRLRRDWIQQEVSQSRRD
jgi:hypothetical protein